MAEREKNIRPSTERVHDNIDNTGLGDFTSSEKAVDVVVGSSDASSTERSDDGSANVPLKIKLFAVLLVTAVGFGSHWSSGVTGAMKSTLKKVVSFECFQENC